MEEQRAYPHSPGVRHAVRNDDGVDRVARLWHLRLVLPTPASPTVLVVEDDRDVRDAMVHLLETEGYAAVAAVDGMDALTQLDGGIEPSVILLDLMMPRMDGWEFLERQRRRGARTPVIVVSAYGLNDQAHGPDVIASMRKPVDIDALLSVVARACARE